MIKQIVGSAAALALIAVAAAPAAAGPWGWGGYHGGFYHGGGYYHGGYYHGGDAVGNVLLGAILGGGLVAVASSASHNHDEAVHHVEDQRYDPRVEGSDARAVAGMCADAVENMARGRVSSIDSVDRDGPGWRVDGVVDAEHDGDRHFYCDVRNGQIETVQLANRETAHRGVH